MSNFLTYLVIAISFIAVIYFLRKKILHYKWIAEFWDRKKTTI